MPDLKPPSAWAPLRSATFRALFFAQLGSNVGVWMQAVGAQWFLVEETHGPALVAWVQTASLVPVVFLSLIAGVLADSYDRRRLLILTTAVSTAAAGVLTVLAIVGVLQPWSLLLVTFVIGCSNALTSPAWQAIQPELVPRDQLAAASSLGSVTVNGARAVGPALAGLLIALSGPALVFALNAISFVGVIVALAAWKRPQQNERGREPIGEALNSGLRYVRSAPIVRRILLRCALFAFPASALWSLLPFVASDRLHLGPNGYGLLLGALGVGSVIGVVVMPVLRARLSSSIILAGSAALFGLGVLSVGFWPFGVALALALPTGLAWIATLTTLNAAMQLSVAEWVRARALSVYLLIFMGSQAVGSFVWGLISSPLGVGPTLLIAAAMLGAVAVSLTGLPLVPETGTLDRSVVPLCTPDPTLIFEPDPADGPLVVTVTYRVAEVNAEAFEAAMIPVSQSRRRTGAYAWSLLRGGEDRTEFQEEFRVRSWGEFERQSSERWTGSDQARYLTAVRLAIADPTIRHSFRVL